MPTFGIEPEEKVVDGEKVEEPKYTVETNPEECNNIIAGDRECFVYFDCEFTGLKKNTDLISIGLIDANGRTFYAEFTDYNKDLIDDLPWFEENIFPNLYNPDTVLEGDNWTITGTFAEIRVQLCGWLDEIIKKGKTIQFVSDVCHFDFVLLIDLLTGGHSAIELPSNLISPCCVDVNQDIATSIGVNNVEEFNSENFLPLKIAFDVDRKHWAESIIGEEIGTKHNALEDAKCIRIIHQTLWNL